MRFTATAILSNTRLMMTVPEILKELEPYTGQFPKKALEAAIEQREAITPELLRVLETAAENPVEFAKREKYMLGIFAMYLLAQFREKRAYRPLVKMFSAPGETAFELAGDTVTEGLKQILGSVYDGDPAPLQGLVEDENVNEYVRSAALDAFVVLVDSGQMSREEAMAYYRSLFQGRLKRTYSHAWNGLVTAVADLPAPELLEEVRQAYKDDLVDPGLAGLGEIERDLLHPDRSYREQYAIITNAVHELEGWACFHPQNPKRKKLPMPQIPLPPPPPAPAPARSVARQAFVREPKIGRNDPCPCGSGKKYKKCCGKG